VLSADLFEDGGIAGVAGEIDFLGAGFEDPSAPMASVAIEGGARSEVLRWHGVGLEGGRKGEGGSPCAFGELGKPFCFHPSEVALGEEEEGIAREFAEGGEVEVVVVAVGEEDEIDGRQVFDA